MALFISRYPRTFTPPNPFTSFGGSQQRQSVQPKPTGEPPPPPPISFAAPEDPALGPQPSGVGTPAYFRQVNAKVRGLNAENLFGIGPEPLLPGSTLPQRAANQQFDYSALPVDQGGNPIGEPVQRNIFTTAPELPAKILSYVNAAGKPVTSAQVNVAYENYLDKVNKANAQSVVLWGRTYEDYLKTVKPGATPLSENEWGQMTQDRTPYLSAGQWAERYGYSTGEVNNPARAEALRGLSEPERDFLARGGAAPSSFGGKEQKPAQTIKDIITRKMSDGKTYRIAVSGDGSEHNLGEVAPVDTRQQERIVHSPTNPDIQRREFSSRDENGKLITQYGAWEWTPAALARKLEEQKITGRAEAQTGAINAINAGAAGAPFVRRFAPDDTTVSQVPDTTYYGPAAGFNPNAPAGSAANPYGDQRGTDYHDLAARKQNEANAARVTAQLHAIGAAGQTANKVLADFKTGVLATKPPAELRAVLQALRDYHGQRNAEGDPLDFTEAIRALETSLQPQNSRVFTRVAGVV